ncbi:hypothetical protein GALL_486930 [mine drainage metagenome]|uniref:Uncharacterized protein n=1 Tax=mine drainage metagenome TaxID=410659 RepID=A0A1J5Q1F1_9ZZZZ
MIARVEIHRNDVWAVVEQLRKALQPAGRFGRGAGAAEVAEVLGQDGAAAGQQAGGVLQFRAECSDGRCIAETMGQR